MGGSQDEIDALRAQIAALTARVYQLEQAAAPLQRKHEPQVSQQKPQRPPLPASGILSPPPRAQQPVPQTAALGKAGVQWPQRTQEWSPSEKSSDLEERIGQYWLNRIGIIAILVGLSYFLKYAFENNWIGPGGRVAIGLLTGIGLILWSEKFRSRGHRAFSYSLKAIGIGALYLSLWAAFQLYHLIPSAVAFVAMVMVTAATIALSLTQDAELLAAFALIGGFATPVLLSSRENHEIVLFSYLSLLDLAILVTALVKPWTRLLWGSLLGTIILYVGWYGDYYTRDQRTVTTLFATLFAAIFAAIPLTRVHEGLKSAALASDATSFTLTFLPLVNAAALFLELYAMYQFETSTLAWFALALAAAYLAISTGFKRLPAPQGKNLTLLHVAIAIAFVTIAIPLKLDAHWITIGWLVESAVLLWVSVKMQSAFLRYLAVTALVMGIFRLLIVDNFHTRTLIFNGRFATHCIAVAILYAIARFGRHYASEAELPWINVASVALNLLALIALTRETADLFRPAVASPAQRVSRRA